MPVRKLVKTVLAPEASSSTETTVSAGSALNDGASLTGVMLTENGTELTWAPPLPNEPRSLTVNRMFWVPKKLAAVRKLNSSNAWFIRPNDPHQRRTPSDPPTRCNPSGKVRSNQVASESNSRVTSNGCPPTSGSLRRIPFSETMGESSIFPDMALAKVQEGGSFTASTRSRKRSTGLRSIPPLAIPPVSTA